MTELLGSRFASTAVSESSSALFPSATAMFTRFGSGIELSGLTRSDTRKSDSAFANSRMDTSATAEIVRGVPGVASIDQRLIRRDGALPIVAGAALEVVSLGQIPFVLRQPRPQLIGFR